MKIASTAAVLIAAVLPPLAVAHAAPRPPRSLPSSQEPSRPRAGFVADEPLPLLAGKPVERKGTDPEQRPNVGDRLPNPELGSLANGKPIALEGQSGALVFRNEKGETIRPRAAIGFFSRY